MVPPQLQLQVAGHLVRFQYAPALQSLDRYRTGFDQAGHFPDRESSRSALAKRLEVPTFARLPAPTAAIV